MDVLFEIVQTRPDLFSVPAMLRCTLIRVLKLSNPMNALLVPVQVVYGREPFPGSATVR